MLPLKDLHSQLDEALNINSSETVFSPLYYTDLINEQRSLWIRNEYNKNRSIDPNIQQVIPCAELELVDPTTCCISLPNSCKVLRTKKVLPNTIEFNFTKGITSIGPVDIMQPRFSLIDYARTPYIGEGRTTANSIYGFLYENKLYIISRNPKISNMKYVNIRGLFEDPTSLADFSDCSDKPCYNANQIYPVNQWMWAYMKDLIVQQLYQRKAHILDDSNNAKDDNSNLSNGTV